MTTTQDIKAASIETWQAYERGRSFYRAYEGGLEDHPIGRILDKIEASSHYPDTMEEPEDMTAAEWRDYLLGLEDDDMLDEEMAHIKREAAAVAKANKKTKALLIKLADAIRAEADKL